MDDRKTVLNFSVSEDLKTRLEQYARDEGLSQAASGRRLLDEALRRAGYPRKGAAK